jgi:hypothetical protein
MMKEMITTKGAGKEAGAWVGGLVAVLLIWLPILLEEGPSQFLADIGGNFAKFTLPFIAFVFLLPVSIVWGLLVGWLAAKGTEAFERRAVRALAGALVGAVGGVIVGGLLVLSFNLLMGNEFSLEAPFGETVRFFVYMLLLSLLVGSVSVIAEMREKTIWVCAQCGSRVRPSASVCPKCHRPLQPPST